MKMVENIYNSAKCFFYILKLLGLAPYGVDSKTLNFKMGFWNYLILLASSTLPNELHL
jgi:hypothetical protein